MKIKKNTLISIITCVVGLSLLLYPTISNYWNLMHATRSINNYVDIINNIDENEYNEILEKANKYNESLLKRENKYVLDSKQSGEYSRLLNLDGNGIMGYITIDKINVNLPIYHGTSNEVLQTATGHINWSSLPVGGESTHAVLSGHRGLPNMKLFTDLDKLIEGDTFEINVLKQTITYEVDQIRIVEPQEINDLEIEENKDYVTLVTCTPYGINTHRLLVRGKRIDNKIDPNRIVGEAVKIDKILVASVLSVPVLLILLLLVIFDKPKKHINKYEEFGIKKSLK